MATPTAKRPLRPAKPRDGSDDAAAVRRPLAQASTLPPRYYTEPETYALEVERIFRREWLSIGRVDQVAKPGDFFCTEIFGEPLVAVRDGSQVRVLSRVCRHRGMAVVAGAGNTSSFQCPYHTWTYALDGRLVGAPEMRRAEDFDRAGIRLPEIRSEIWEGWIFVNFDDRAWPLAPALEPLMRAVAPYGLAQFRSTPPLVFDSPWNWKIMVDNFMESYHHLGIHADTLQYFYPASGTYAEDSDGPYAILRNPARPDVEIGTELPQVAGLTDDLQSLLFVAAVFPYHLFAVTPDLLTYYQIEPRTVDHFILRIFVCALPEALDDPARAAALESAREFVNRVHLQDIVACSGVQAGYRSTTARPGRYSHLEKALWQFHRWVLDRLESG
jgi:phenylpropionate dioxygenase-like ring-hydroxylating dioxygenase large terminal subunit